MEVHFVGESGVEAMGHNPGGVFIYSGRKARVNPVWISWKQDLLRTVINEIRSPDMDEEKQSNN